MSVCPSPGIFLEYLQEIKFVKSELNVSDIFTKNLSENLFHHHAETLGIIPRNKEGVNVRDKVVSREDNNISNDEGRHVLGQIGRTKEERSVES